MENARSGREHRRLRERRSCNNRGVLPPRARRPRAVESLQSSPRHKSTRTRQLPQRRSLNSVLSEAKQFTPCLAVDAATLHRSNYRKYTGQHRCCTHCTPNSKSKNTGDIPGMCGLLDLLKVDWRKFRRFPHNMSPYFSFVIHQPLTPQRDYRRATLSSPRVQEAIIECAKLAQEQGKNEEVARKEQEKRAREIVWSMSSGVYRPLVRIVAWLFFWTFGRMFERLDIQQSHTGMLLQAQQRGVPIVFLPSHKSHMDYLIMTFVLFSIGIKLPRVAAGDNLKLPFVSWLVTHLGGFFIKRRLDFSDKKDILYRKCLHEYMERLLEAGENIEFFLEGSRSRSGKPCCPKAGLLSVVVDTVKEGLVEDVLIVPINICYDRLVEKNFVKDELMGGEKRPETLLAALKAVWSFLTRKVGVVRVDVSQPFSLQEFLSTSVISKGSLLELSGSCVRGSTINISQSTYRRLITALSYHIMYDITLCTSLTPTSLVAFLLLNRYRQHGATIDELINNYLQLERLAELHGRVVSSYLSAGEAVHYALHHLLSLITIDEVMYRRPLNGVVAGKDQTVRPVLTLPIVMDLYHLSNQTASLLARHSLVAYSLLSTARCTKSRNINQEKVIESASFLAQLLTREFIFTPPCEELNLSLLEVLDDFVNSEILRRVGSGHHGNRRPSYLEMDDEDWDEYVPVIEYQFEADGKGRLSLFASVLEPLVESYWLTSTQLLLLLPLSPTHILTENGLVKEIQTAAIGKAENGQLSRVESCSCETIRNAVKTLRDQGVLVHAHNNTLEVANSNHLIQIIKQLTLLQS